VEFVINPRIERGPNDLYGQRRGDAQRRLLPRETSGLFRQGQSYDQSKSEISLRSHGSRIRLSSAPHRLKEIDLVSSPQLEAPALAAALSRPRFHRSDLQSATNYADRFLIFCVLFQSRRRGPNGLYPLPFADTKRSPSSFIQDRRLMGLFKIEQIPPNTAARLMSGKRLLGKHL
jgi:hypothetical protein